MTTRRFFLVEALTGKNRGFSERSNTLCTIGRTMARLSLGKLRTAADANF